MVLYYEEWCSMNVEGDGIIPNSIISIAYLKMRIGIKFAFTNFFN